MKKKYFLIIIPIIILSCYYDNEEALYPDPGGECDTTAVSYSADIVPMLSTYCYACHDNLNAPSFGNNIKMEEYADVKNQSESILGAIKHDPQYSPMPKGGSKLSDCLIMKFEAWVNQGGVDN